MEKLLKFLSLNLRNDLRDAYPSQWVIPIEVLRQMIWLSILWHVSRAFEPSLPFELRGMSYFLYIVLADILISIPILLFTGFSQRIRDWVDLGFFDQVLLSPRPLIGTLCLGSLSDIVIEVFASGITILLCAMFFEWGIGIVPLLQAIGLLIFIFPVFIGLGLMLAGAYIWIQRGSSIINQLSGLVVVSSGVYFPISFFPQPISRMIEAISPFYYFIEISRNLLVNNPIGGDQIQQYLVTSLFSGLACCILGVLAIQGALKFHRKRGSILFGSL